MHEGTATQPATKKGEETRDRILAAATELIHQRGYKATGVAEIVAASGVPKGSFYFYFASKEELGRVLLQREDQRQADDRAVDDPRCLARAEVGYEPRAHARRGAQPTQRSSSGSAAAAARSRVIVAPRRASLVRA